jgi:hypothetical protein
VRERIKARMEEPPEPLLRLDADERRALRDLLRKALDR